jgi:hypothetical protein
MVSKERIWLGMCGSSQKSLETSLTGMEFNHITHCGEAFYWFKKKVVNKRTFRPIHPANQISELYFV